MFAYETCGGKVAWRGKYDGGEEGIYKWAAKRFTLSLSLIGNSIP